MLWAAADSPAILRIMRGFPECRRRTRFPGYVLLGFALFMQAGQGIVDDRLEAHFANDSLLTRVRIVDFPKAKVRSVLMQVEPLVERADLFGDSSGIQHRRERHRHGALSVAQRS